MSFTIGFIGLGAMGSLMADNLLQAGHSLQVWNRTAARCTPLVERGAKACDNPAQAAQSADFVVSMVADDAATAEVMLGTGGVLETFRGQAIIDCSTNSPAAATAVTATEVRLQPLKQLSRELLGVVLLLRLEGAPPTRCGELSG